MSLLNAMRRRGVPMVLLATAAAAPAAAPVVAPVAGWLLTTHSGDDVLTVSADGRVAPLVAAKAGGLDGARGVVVGPGGDLFVASSKKDHSAVLRFGRDGAFKGVFAAGTKDRMVHPYDLAFAAGGDLFVSGQDDDTVTRYDGATGAYKATVVPAGAGGLKTVRGICFMPVGRGGGDLLVASRDTDAVLRYDGQTGRPKGPFVRAGGGGLSKPIQVRYGPDGHVYVGSSGTDAVLRYDGSTGAYLGVAARGGGLKGPSGFAFSPADGDLYVAGRLSNKILRFDGKTGAFKGQVAGGGAVDRPEFLVPNR